MKQALLIITLLAPASAIAGGSISGDGDRAATTENTCAYNTTTCATIERWRR